MHKRKDCRPYKSRGLIPSLRRTQGQDRQKPGTSSSRTKSASGKVLSAEYFHFHTGKGTEHQFSQPMPYIRDHGQNLRAVGFLDSDTRQMQIHRNHGTLQPRQTTITSHPWKNGSKNGSMQVRRESI